MHAGEGVGVLDVAHVELAGFVWVRVGEYAELDDFGLEAQVDGFGGRGLFRLFC